MSHPDSKCNLLPDPQNGQVEVRGVTIGSVATYKCAPGYRVQGFPNRICDRHLRWSGMAPLCVTSGQNNEMAVVDTGFNLM